MTAVFEETHYKRGNKETGTDAKFDFDRYVNYYEKLILFIVRQFTPGERLVVLDHARGSSTFDLRKAGHNVYGIDLPRHVFLSEKANNSLYPQTFNLSFWKPGDRLFDSIFCFGVLEYLNNVDRSIETLSSTLNQNGLLYAHWYHYGWRCSVNSNLNFPIKETRTNCLVRAEFIYLARKHGLEYDAAVSQEFEKNGLVALHEFSIENPESLFKKLYSIFYRVFGLNLSLKVLKASNKDLEFIALRKV